MPEPAASTGRLRAALVVAGLVLLVVAALLFLNRKTLAREALTGWLRSKGVPAQAQVTAFGPSRFRATLRVGDGKAPDFSAADVDVRYRLKGLGLEVQSVTLTRPVLRASLKGGTLRAGALDPLIEEFRRRPPRPDAAKPVITVDNGVLLLATDYGPTRIAADVIVADGKLLRLTGSSATTRLRGQGLDLTLAPTSFDVIERGGRLAASVAAPRVSGRFGEMILDDAAVTVSGGAPYPDLVKRRGDGALIAKVLMTGRGLRLGEQGLSDFNLDLAFVGQTAGWVRSLTTTGQLSGELRARTLNAAGAEGGDLKAAVTMADLRWTRSGGDQVSGTLKLTGTANRLRAGTLDLSQITAAVVGPVALGRGRTDLDLTGSAVGRGAWTALGRPTAADSPQFVALKRGLSAFRFAAPGVGFKFHEGAAAFSLPGELRVLPDTGGAITAKGDPAVAMRLEMAGGGLPRVSAQIANLRFAPGGVSADSALKGEFSAGPVLGGRIDTAGRLAFANGRATFIASRCADLAADRLEFGANDIEAFAGRVCPTGRPLLVWSHGDWTVAGRAEAVAARAPFLQAAVEAAGGRIELGSARQTLRAAVTIDQAQIRDLAPERRFNTLAMTGRAELVREVWSADLLFRLNETSIGTANLVHGVTTGRGGVVIDTGPLAFLEGGLQPGQLSPLAETLGSPAVGGARFQGRFDWTPAGVTSNGTLSIPGLDFTSPAGRVSGLAGDVVFTSLAPLIAAPGQELRIARLDAIVPVANLSTTFGLRDDTLHVAGGTAEVGGGHVHIESLNLPFAVGAPLKGVLRIEGVQLHDLVEASPFGERIDFDAKVSGRLPFEVRDGKVRIARGSLKADQPGRISIQRALFAGATGAAGGQVTATGVAAPVAEALSGAVDTAAANDTFMDMALQGLENLAFQELDATINSRDDGRLAVLFHIRGEHDPPKKQQIRMSLADLLSRRFLGRPLPLPSRTKVNLTLDTTLNLDELLADYADYQRLRSSGPVQP